VSSKKGGYASPPNKERGKFITWAFKIKRGRNYLISGNSKKALYSVPPRAQIPKGGKNIPGLTNIKLRTSSVYKKLPILYVRAQKVCPN